MGTLRPAGHFQKALPTAGGTSCQFTPCSRNHQHHLHGNNRCATKAYWDGKHSFSSSERNRVPEFTWSCNRTRLWLQAKVCDTPQSPVKEQLQLLTGIFLVPDLSYELSSVFNVHLQLVFKSQTECSTFQKCYFSVEMYSLLQRGCQPESATLEESLCTRAAWLTLQLREAVTRQFDSYAGKTTAAIF